MSITLDLPSPIDEELTKEAQREGISEMEHAALLVCLAFALKQDEPPTPFRNAVKDFLFQNSLDAERVFDVFDELVRTCLSARDIGNSTADLEEKLTDAVGQGNYELLNNTFAKNLGR
jgi:hypothetical protein